jgi:hypothetical protein
MARPRGFEPLTYRFVARSDEGSDDNQDHPSTTKDEDSGDGEGGGRGLSGLQSGLYWSQSGSGGIYGLELALSEARHGPGAVH